MIALACNLDLFRSRILAGFAAVSFARLHRALAWQVRTLGLFNRRHFSLLLLTFLFTSIAVGSRRVRTLGSLPQIA
jgi:hypothetical protein